MKEMIRSNVRSVDEDKEISDNIGNKKLLITDIFGIKIPSVSGIKKLKTDKILKLARYLEFDVPTPTLN